MKYLLFAIVLFVTTMTSASAVDDNHYVTQAQNWFSNLKVAKTRFEQIDYQGQSIFGTFYINKPGRLRFEYDAPIKDYIVADGYLIHFYDGDSGQVNSGPIGSTLADFILRKGNSFNDKVTIESVRELDDIVMIAVSQTDQPGMGQLVLNFTKDPFDLNSWRIIDAQGLTTDVILSDLNRDVDLSPTLFRINNQNLNE